MKNVIADSDEYGIDPLSKDLLDEILSIREYATIIIDAKYVSNPQLLSYDTYGDVELYYVILMYNGIGNSFTLDRGMKILLPNRERVNEILSRRAKQTVQRITI